MATKKPSNADRVELAHQRAEAAGMRLEQSDAGYRMTTGNGTLAAAVWTNPDGYGLTLDQIEAILDGTYEPPAPAEPAVEQPLGDGPMITTTAN